MSTYTIEITEILQKQINIDADCYCDAIDKVKEMYSSGEIKLTSEDLTNTNFEEPVGCSIARQMRNR